MSDTAAPIDVAVERNETGEITCARLRFGPHFGAEVRADAGSVTFELVYTHHGFRADATEPGGELEQIIQEIRRSRPETVVD